MNTQKDRKDSLSPLSDSLKSVDLTGHPPVDSWEPEFVGEIDIVIRPDGTWLHEGTVFQRTSLVKLFASILWYEDGIHYLKTPAEKMRIEVADAAFFIPTLEVIDLGTDEQQLVFTSTYGDKVIAGSGNPIEVEEHTDTGEPQPYVGMRYGMRGKLSRHVFYQLAELAEVAPCRTMNVTGEGDCLFVRSAGEIFVLGLAS